jgi:hypothetical protein
MYLIYFLGGGIRFDAADKGEDFDKAIGKVKAEDK